MQHSREELQLLANTIRQDIISMLKSAGSGHSAGPLGLADVFTALYFEILNHRSDDPDWDDRDILVLSNGHVAPVRYATMARAGYFDVLELKTLRKFGSNLQGHPERTRLPGLETTSGPLGSGLSQAVGMSLGLKMDNTMHRWVYCVMSDGEQNEGNTWEAAMLAAKYKLHNLTAITDRNSIQIEGPTEEVMPLEDLRSKWQSFGWHVLEVDGHNIKEIVDACEKAKAIVGKPVMILAYTVPGKGVDFMEYDYQWHGKPPDAKQAKQALHQLRTLDGEIRGEHE